jgi:hypothetical protein
MSGHVFIFVPIYAELQSVRTAEVSVSLPKVRQQTGLPLWTWFIDNPRPEHNFQEIKE